MTPITPTFIAKQGQYVAVPFNARLAGAIPHAKPFEWQGNRMLLLPNKPEEAKVARNLGIPSTSAHTDALRLAWHQALGHPAHDRGSAGRESTVLRAIFYGHRED